LTNDINYIQKVMKFVQMEVLVGCLGGRIGPRIFRRTEPLTPNFASARPLPAFRQPDCTGDVWKRKWHKSV